MDEDISKDKSRAPSYAEPVSDVNISYEEFQRIKQRFEEMQRIAQFGTWDWDIKNDQYFLSDGACHIYGIGTKANILEYESVAGFRHPDDRETVGAALRAAMDGGKPYSLDYRVIRPDGEIRHVHEYGSAVYDNGVPVRAFGSIKDNTENMKTQEKLKESEHLYRTLFENTEDAFLIVEPVYDTNGKVCDFRLIQFNDNFEKQTGIKPGDIAGRLAKEMHPDIESHWIETCEKVIKAGKTMHYQNYSKGTNRWYDMICFPYLQGRAGAIFRDITQYKAADEALREANESNRQILDSINDGYGMFDRDTTILKIGKKFADQFGKTPEECVGMKLNDYLPGGIYEALGRQRKEYISKVFDTGKLAEFQDTRDGRWYNHRCYPVFKDGKVKAVSIFSTDITDTKKAEEEERKNEQLRIEAELLRKKEREYLELLDGTEEGMWIIDFKEKRVELSPKWAQRLGVSDMAPEELFDRIDCCIHEDDKERVLSGRREVTKNKQPGFSQEYRILTAGSDYIWVLDRGKILYDENGTEVKIYASSMDISARRKAEETLSKALLREKVLGGITSRLLECEDPQAVIEAICRKTVEYTEGDVFFNYICEGGRLHLNACSGIPSGEAEKLEWLEYGEAICGCAARDGKRIVITDLQSSADPRVQLLKTFGIQRYASFPLKSDDNIIGTLAFGSRKLNGFTGDELLFLSSVSEHVAIAMNRLIISRSLHESEERYRELVEHAPTGIYGIDLRGEKLTSANDAMSRILGYSREELLSMSPLDLLDAESRERFRQRIQRRLAGEYPDETVDYKVIAKDGREAYVSLDVSFTKDQDGKPLGVTAIVHDITHRKKDEAVINRKNRILQVINIIHERSVSCGTMNELEMACLGIVNAVTNSGVSFIGELKGERLMYEISLSSVTRDGAENVHRRLGRLNHAGLFKDVVDSKASMLINEASSCPGSTGVSGSDIEISSFLGVPFIRNGKAAGLIAAANREGGYTEDEKEVLEALAPAIYEVLMRKRVEEALKESEERLADEFNAVTRIQKISASFVQEGDFESILYNILKAAIMISGAYKGTLQLLRPGTDHLEITAQLGFDQSYIDFFSSVSHDSDSVCVKALQQEERVIVEDITKSPIFINTPALNVQIAAGVRAVQSTPLINRRGKVIGILSTHWDRPCYPSENILRYIDLLAGQAADIIERKRAEEELRDSEECALALVKRLEEADRNKNDFLSALSHEIRNPLATISAGLQLMDMSHDERHIKNAREIIDRQMDQLCSLVDDLLDLTRISNNRIELKKQRIELGRLASLVAKDHIPLANRKGLKLETDLGEDIYADADPVRIKQIIGNLLHNAFKFTEEGTITLSVYEENGQAAICVKDTGIGISHENLSRIFEPFMQIGSHIDRQGGGLGLGLSIVKAIAQLHGGDAGVYSEGEGKGSEFYIRLPAVKDGAGAQEENEAGAEAQKRLKVLAIEDNKDYSEMMCELLRFLGHDVTSAPDGIEGIKRAKEDVPDVIICDIGLPGINGFETARRIMKDESLKNVFLVSLTGYAGPQYAEDAQNAGFDLYITKPVDIDALRRILRKACE